MEVRARDPAQGGAAKVEASIPIAMKAAGLDPREPVDADENWAALLLAGMLEGNPFEAVVLEWICSCG